MHGGLREGVYARTHEHIMTIDSVQVCDEFEATCALLILTLRNLTLNLARTLTLTLTPCVGSLLRAVTCCRRAC